MDCGNRLGFGFQGYPNVCCRYLDHLGNALNSEWYIYIFEWGHDDQSLHCYFSRNFIG